MDISSTVWVSNLGTFSTCFNTGNMNAAGVTPSQLIFKASESYRDAQITHNNTLPSGGPYINFASPVTADNAPSIDEAGDFSLSKQIFLRSKIVYSPNPGVEPQTGTTII